MPEKGKHHKILHPKPAPEGLRRSKRTRLAPLDWFRNERPVYGRTKDGLEILDVQSPGDQEADRRKEILLRRRIRQAEKDLIQSPLSTHVDQHVPEDCSFVECGEIVVQNPSSPADEISLECIKTHTSCVYWGPTGERSLISDPFAFSKHFNEDKFTTGEFVLRPKEEKPTQTVSGHTMIFYIVEGKISVTIHETASVLKSRDVFYVPPENTYSLQNLRNTSARLFFTLLKRF